MKLELSDLQKTEALESICRFMSAEIEADISEMQAEFILDYFTKELAPFAYNKGIEDAQKFLMEKTEDLGGTCFEDGLTYWNKSKNRPVARKPTNRS